MMRIDSETYKVKEINCHKTKTLKTQIVLATSLRKNGYHIIRLTHKEYGNTKKWNTYTVSRSGVVFQHYNEKYYTDFLGIENADKQSISIVIENMGCLFKTHEGKYINWLNEICDEKDVVMREWLGYSYWERFNNDQIKNVVQLCKQLCDKYDIPKTCVDFRNYHKDILKFKGIVFKSNYVEDCSDINPLFDIPGFNEMLSK